MYRYLNVEASDIPMMIEMYREYLNDGESIADQIISGFNCDGFIGIKCVNDADEICGIFSACKGIRFTCDHFDLVKEIEDCCGDAVIYTAEMIVVLPEFRHQGIANGLVAKFGESLKESDAQYFLIELWREPSGRIPGRVVLGVLGGEIEHRYYPDFYKDLPAFDLTCPICGKYCKCGADICLLEVEDTERKASDELKKEVHQN